MEYHSRMAEDPSTASTPQWPRYIALSASALVVGLIAVTYALSLPSAVAREQDKRTLGRLLNSQPAFDEDCSGLEPTAKNQRLGAMPRPAPDLAAQDVNGKTVHLSAYRGQVVMVNFWASWCPPCVEEMPSMEELQRAYPKLVIMAISADPSWADIRHYFDKGSALTVLWDPSAAPAANGDSHVGALAQSWGTDQIPESYLVDRDGNIRYYIVNTREWTAPEARRCIERLLAQ